MKLKYAILYVSDVPKTLEFYQKAFGFETKMLHEGKDYGELDTGETILAFSSLQLMTDLGKNPSNVNPAQPSFEIAFETPDVKSALANAIASGASLVQDERKEPWGQTTSYVNDINGFLIEICSPVG